MKNRIILSIISACLLAVPATSAPAVEKKAKAENPPAGAPKAATVVSDKPMPMNARVDSIDEKGKTFTQKRKDGMEVKHTVTDKTEIMQDGKAAKFGDIKVGDMVGGLRMKKGEGEYEVIKITKFGPKTAKAAAGEKEKKMKKAPAGEAAAKAGQ